VSQRSRHVDGLAGFRNLYDAMHNNSVLVAGLIMGETYQRGGYKNISFYVPLILSESHGCEQVSASETCRRR
jgi:hypothetical protein